MSVGQWADQWLRAQRVRLKPNSLQSYTRMLTTFLPAEVLSTPIEKLTRSLIRDVLLAKLDQGYSTGTVYHALDILRACLNAALDEEPPLIHTNPCVRLGKLLPRRKPPKRQPAVPRDLVSAIVTAAERLNQSVAVLILVGFRTGLRVGELLGLQWEDVDLEHRRVTVRRADWRYADGTPKGGEVHTLPLSEDAALQLQALRDGTSHPPTGWIFEGHESGRPWARETVRRTLRHAMEVVGLPPASAHSLRASFATHLAEQGESPWTIKELLRHSSVTMSETYVRSASNGHHTAVDRLRGGGET